MLGYKSFVILAVVALADAARAEMPEEDALEIAKLPKEMKVFADFCLDSRDRINVAQKKLEEETMQEKDAEDYKDAGEVLEAACVIVDKLASEAHEQFDLFKSTLRGDKFAATQFSDVPCFSSLKIIESVATCASARARLDKIHKMFPTSK